MLLTPTSWCNSKIPSVECNNRILNSHLLRNRAKKSLRYPWTSSRKKMRRKTTSMTNILTPIQTVTCRFLNISRCRAAIRVLSNVKRQMLLWWCRIIKSTVRMRNIVITSILLVNPNMTISISTPKAMIKIIRIKTRLETPMPRNLLNKPAWRPKNQAPFCKSRPHLLMPQMSNRIKVWVKLILMPSFWDCRARPYFQRVLIFLKKLNSSLLIRTIYLDKPRNLTNNLRKTMNNILAFSIKRKMRMTQACNTRKRIKISSVLVIILMITPLYETRQVQISTKHLSRLMIRPRKR